MPPPVKSTAGCVTIRADKQRKLSGTGDLSSLNWTTVDDNGEQANLFELHDTSADAMPFGLTRTGLAFYLVGQGRCLGTLSQLAPNKWLIVYT